MVHGMLHGMVHGVLHGMVHGMLHGMVHGMLHGMVHCVVMPPVPSAEQVHASVRQAAILHVMLHVRGLIWYDAGYAAWCAARCAA